MRTLISLFLLAILFGCTSGKTTVQPELILPAPTGTALASDFSAADFKAVLVGQWESVFTYKNRSNVQRLELTSDGHARVLVVDADSSPKQYAGVYTITFDREPSAGAVTSATITIVPDHAPDLVLSRVNFGLHNGVYLRDAFVLRIDGGPYGVLKKTD